MALAVLLAHPLFHTRVPLAPAFALLGFWIFITLFTWRRLKQPGHVSQNEILLHLIIDIAMLTALLAVSGGPANPLTALYLPPIAVAAAVLPVKFAGLTITLSVMAYSLLWKFSLPLTVEDVDRAMQMHLTGMWLTFALSALLIAGFVGRSTHALRQREQALRERDQQLAIAREQALRDERIVALGNLAAGAAHELGTPLATMAVIIGELARDPQLPAEQQEDVTLLSRQITACKSIISGLAERAGVGRAESGQTLAADTWLHALVDRWHALRPAATASLNLTTSHRPAPSIFSDPTLDQALINLFNNAEDASPGAVTIEADWTTEHLRIRILDRGQGISEALRAQAGHQPFTTRPDGVGIGLLLAHAAITRHGGQIDMQPRTDGQGSQVHVELPLHQSPPVQAG